MLLTFQKGAGVTVAPFQAKIKYKTGWDLLSLIPTTKKMEKRPVMAMSVYYDLYMSDRNEVIADTEKPVCESNQPDTECC